MTDSSKGLDILRSADRSLRRLKFCVVESFSFFSLSALESPLTVHLEIEKVHSVVKSSSYSEANAKKKQDFNCSGVTITGSRLAAQSP